MTIQQPGNLPGRTVWMFQRQLHHLLFHLLRNPVSNLVRAGAMILQAFFSIFQILLVPTIKRAARYLQFVQGFLHTQGRMLHQMDDLPFLRFISPDHSSHFVSLPSKLFLAHGSSMSTRPPLDAFAAAQLSNLFLPA